MEGEAENDQECSRVQSDKEQKGTCVNFDWLKVVDERHAHHCARDDPSSVLLRILARVTLLEIIWTNLKEDLQESLALNPLDALP